MTEPDDLNALKELLCFNVYSLNRSFARFYQSAFSETGMTYAKFVVLMVLSADGPMSVTALSNQAGVEANTLSPILKKMADFGLVTRKRATDDERRVELDITPKGREVLARGQAVVEEGFANLGIATDQLVNVIKFLDATREVVDDADPPKLSLDGIS